MEFENNIAMRRVSINLSTLLTNPLSLVKMKNLDKIALHYVRKSPFLSACALFNTLIHEIFQTLATPFFTDSSTLENSKQFISSVYHKPVKLLTYSVSTSTDPQLIILKYEGKVVLENKAVILIAEEKVCVTPWSMTNSVFLSFSFPFTLFGFPFLCFQVQLRLKLPSFVDLLQLKILTVLSVCLVLLQGMYKPFERFH